MDHSSWNNGKGRGDNAPDNTPYDAHNNTPDNSNVTGLFKDISSSIAPVISNIAETLNEVVNSEDDPALLVRKIMQVCDTAAHDMTEALDGNDGVEEDLSEPSEPSKDQDEEGDQDKGNEHDETINILKCLGDMTGIVERFSGLDLEDAENNKDTYTQLLECFFGDNEETQELKERMVEQFTETVDKCQVMGEKFIEIVDGLPDVLNSENNKNESNDPEKEDQSKEDKSEEDHPMTLNEMGGLLDTAVKIFSEKWNDISSTANELKSVQNLHPVRFEWIHAPSTTPSTTPSTDSPSFDPVNSGKSFVETVQGGWRNEFVKASCEGRVNTYGITALRKEFNRLSPLEKAAFLDSTPECQVFVEETTTPKSVDVPTSACPWADVTGNEWKHCPWIKEIAERQDETQDDIEELVREIQIVKRNVAKQGMKN